MSADRILYQLIIKYWLQLANLTHHVRHRDGYPARDCGCPGCVAAINRMYASGERDE